MASRALQWTGRISAGLLIVAIVWQHVANINQWHYKPSQSLNSAACWLQRQWRLVGEWFAWASSFIEYLHFRELFQSIGEVVAPIGRMVMSITFVVDGYYAYIMRHHYTAAVVAGSLILIGLALLLAARYGRGALLWLVRWMPEAVRARVAAWDLAIPPPLRVDDDAAAPLDENESPARPSRSAGTRSRRAGLADSN